MQSLWMLVGKFELTRRGHQSGDCSCFLWTSKRYHLKWNRLDHKSLSRKRDSTGRPDARECEEAYKRNKTVPFIIEFCLLVHLKRQFAATNSGLLSSTPENETRNITCSQLSVSRDDQKSCSCGQQGRSKNGQGMSGAWLGKLERSLHMRCPQGMCIRVANDC